MQFFCQVNIYTMALKATKIMLKGNNTRIIISINKEEPGKEFAFNKYTTLHPPIIKSNTNVDFTNISK